MDINKETKEFIKENADKDVRDLALQAGKDSNIDMPFALRQIEGRQKIRLKIPSFYVEDELIYPLRLSLEQASSEITAQYKSSLCEGKVLADLTGGFGIDSFFLSSRFEQAYYVERNEELCQIAEHNFRLMNKSQIKVVCGDGLSFLTDIQKEFDWIYIDPARRDKTGKKSVLLADCEPDISKIYPQLLSKAKQVLIKLSPMIDITSVLQDIPQVSQVHIIAVDNECKEVLFVLDSNKTEPICIHTRNFVKSDSVQIFDYGLDDERNSSAQFTANPQKYLYEPNAAIMKSAAFKLISSRYGLAKLHKNTHLYSSDKLIADFPGRIFEILSLWGNSKQEWKSRLKTLSKANITVRNYPLSADELRKKLKLKDGGDIFLFACTLINESKTIVECRKVIV